MTTTVAPYKPSELTAKPALQLTNAEQLDQILDAAIRPTNDAISPKLLENIALVLAVAAPILIIIGALAMHTGLGLGLGIALIGLGALAGLGAAALVKKDCKPHQQVVRNAAKYGIQEMFSPNGGNQKSPAQREYDELAKLTTLTQEQSRRMRELDQQLHGVGLGHRRAGF